MRGPIRYCARSESVLCFMGGLLGYMISLRCPKRNSYKCLRSLVFLLVRHSYFSLYIGAGCFTNDTFCVNYTYRVDWDDYSVKLYIAIEKVAEQEVDRLLAKSDIEG